MAIVETTRTPWRGTLRTRRSNGAIRVRQTLDDLDGPNQITARAAGPDGLTCEAVATIAA